MGTQLTRLTPLPTGGWRDDAACARDTDLTLWDQRVGDDKEPPVEQAARHAKAKAICWSKCPVRDQCAADVDWRLDEGVRGGHVLPLLNAHANPGASARDKEMVRLLQAGWPLDAAAKAADRLLRGAAS